MGQPTSSLQELALRANAYERGKFHPVFVGDLYHHRYLVRRKLGYGMYSTVWLVVDVYSERHYALKVLSAECYGAGHDTFEREILQRLQQESSTHPGSQYSSQLVDDFAIFNDNQWHVCFVFNIMAETFVNFGDIFVPDHIPSNIIKRFVKQILLGLDYAHGLGIIHTSLSISSYRKQDLLI